MLDKEKKWIRIRSEKCWEKETHKAMKRLKMKQMKLLNSNSNGRVRLTQSMWSMSPLACMSRGCTLAAFSASPSRIAWRIRNTGAYVSQRKGIPSMLMTPEATAGDIRSTNDSGLNIYWLAITMNTHLIPIVWVIKPPATGPMAGPMINVHWLINHSLGRRLNANQAKDPRYIMP